MRQQTRQQHSGKFTFTSSYIHTYIYTSLILVNMRVATETFYDFCHHSCCHLLLLQQFTALCIIYMSMTHVLCRQPLALFHTLSLSLLRLPANIFYAHGYPKKFSSFICIIVRFMLCPKTVLPNWKIYWRKCSQLIFGFSGKEKISSSKTICYYFYLYFFFFVDKIFFKIIFPKVPGSQRN